MTPHNDNRKMLDKTGAFVTGLAPLLFLIAMLWHPPLVGRLPDSVAVAEAASDDLTRWGLSHLSLVPASAAVVLAFIAVRALLRDAGDGWPSAVGLGFVVLGSVAYVVLPGMEMSLIVASDAGIDLVAAQDSLEPWFVPTFAGGAVLFAIGTFAFAVAIARSAVATRATRLTIAISLVVFGLSRAVPVGIAQFYVQSAAALLSLGLLAVVMWTSASREAGVAR